MTKHAVYSKAKEETGIDVGNMPMETVPETEEFIHMQMEWKPSNCFRIN
jgi:hypothetical protein